QNALIGHVLPLAIELGCDVPRGLFDAPKVAKRERRRRVALTRIERDLFAACAPRPDAAPPGPQARGGDRISAPPLSARGPWDLERGLLLVPDPKEKRPKAIPLLDAEIEIARIAVAPLVDRGALIWPAPDGGAWPVRDDDETSVQNSAYERAFWDA